MTDDSPELQAYKAKATKSANQWLQRWTLLLKAKGIKRIHVSYSGSGDDGGIENISCSKRTKGDGPKHWVEIDTVIGKARADDFESLMYDVITHHGAGFTDDGCSGEVDWNIPLDMFVHNLSYNVTTTEDHRFDGVDGLSDGIDLENR